MSAIDFSMNISREADPKGDRVKVSALQNLLSERRAPRPLSVRHARWVVRPAHYHSNERKHSVRALLSRSLPAGLGDRQSSYQVRRNAAKSLWVVCPP
jgi:Cyanate lyase C-terminal domain